VDSLTLGHNGVDVTEWVAATTAAASQPAVDVVCWCECESESTSVCVLPFSVLLGLLGWPYISGLAATFFHEVPSHPHPYPTTIPLLCFALLCCLLSKVGSSSQPLLRPLL
jgi:hypothetical protein